VKAAYSPGVDGPWIRSLEHHSLLGGIEQQTRLRETRTEQDDARLRKKTPDVQCFGEERNDVI
jgi:hypothetical protein